MIYPFIYTGTRYYDFRVVTSKMLKGLPQSALCPFTEIARAMINADNTLLQEPSWALVKRGGYILWGISVLNKVLGDKCQDDDGRPVRGFFGIISDNDISRLPYDISFFSELYRTYVDPVWDSYAQTEQVTVNISDISGFDFIEKSTLKSCEINSKEEICRVFSNGYAAKYLIEAVFASSSDCSIAVNIHRKRQCIEFGKDKLSFANIVMSSDSGSNKTEDISVYVKENVSDNNQQLPLAEERNSRVVLDESVCNICGKSVPGYGGICADCNRRLRNRKYLKYGLYGFMALICLLLLFNGSKIWEIVLPENHANETSFLRTDIQEISVSETSFEDVFRISYMSSSPIKRVVSSNGWIKIITSPRQYSNVGVIEFVCEPLLEGERVGEISISNRNGEEITIHVHQAANDYIENVVNVEEDDRGNSTVINHSAEQNVEVSSDRNDNVEANEILEPHNDNVGIGDNAKVDRSADSDDLVVPTKN